jgi:hypothetical protein
MPSSTQERDDDQDECGGRHGDLPPFCRGVEPCRGSRLRSPQVSQGKLSAGALRREIVPDRDAYVAFREAAESAVERAHSD